MNTHVKALSNALTSPSMLDLWRDFVAAYKNWRHKRLLASIDFRELHKDEITDEIRQDIERVKKISRENLINI